MIPDPQGRRTARSRAAMPVRLNRVGHALFGRELFELGDPLL
jgi:hypothetical protein